MVAGQHTRLVRSGEVDLVEVDGLSPRQSKR